MHPSPFIRGGVLQGGPQGVHEGVRDLQAQFGPDNGGAPLPEARRQVARPEQADALHDVRGAGFRVRIGFRERRPPLLRQAGQGQGDGDGQELHHHPSRVLRQLLLLRHSGPSGHHRRLSFQGIHTRRGREDGLEERVQRRHPGRRGTDGQHVRHRMQEEMHRGQMRGPQMPGRPLSKAGDRPFRPDRPPPFHFGRRWGQEGLRELRHKARHDRRR